MARDEEQFSIGQEIQGFLVLQESDDQYEMPVTLTVRRIEGLKIGCSMICVIPHHEENINGFLGELENRSS